MNKYSQYNEEIFLIEFFKNITNGVLVDVGAADGINNSNSRRLIEIGWGGLLIEPNINNFNKLNELYSNHVNIFLENVGCGNETIKNVNFYIDKNDDYQQLSTFSNKQVKKCKTIYNCDFINVNIDIFNTTEILKKYNLKKINFMSIDTESYDLNVLKGIDFEYFDIDLICIEDWSEELDDLLKNSNYNIVHKTQNIFYSKK